MTRLLALSCVLFLTGCSGRSAPTSPSVTVPSAPNTGSSASSTNTHPANGSVTLVSVNASRSLCDSETSQVGTTYPLWLTMISNGTTLDLQLANADPSTDLFGDGVIGGFTGTRTGDQVTAILVGPSGGFACPGDKGVTLQVGGTLTATISDGQISGEYTQIYGTGDGQVTEVYRFHASL